MARETGNRIKVDSKVSGTELETPRNTGDEGRELLEKQREVANSAEEAGNGQEDSKYNGETEFQQVQKEEIEGLKLENTELKEKILRMAAENQNTRKRLVKQQQDSFRYRHQDILKDLADVIDNFERAIESSKGSQDFHNFYEGVMMIEKQFSSMLAEKYGMEKIGQEGEPFDPAAHEAVMLEESEDVDSQIVKQVFQAGYRLHERVLRPAKVVVVKPAGLKTRNNNEEQ